VDLGFANGVISWTLGPAIAGAAFVVLVAAKLLARRVSARPDDPRLGQALVSRLVLGTMWPILLLLALYLGSLAVPLPGTAANAARAAAVLALLAQAGIWGRELITFVTQRYQQRAVEEERSVSPSTMAVLRFFGTLTLWSVLLLLALENVGIQVTALVAGLGIGGIAVALAAQSILSDLFASFAIMLDRPFEVGDFIIVGELMGSVEHVGIKTTRVRSLSGEQLIFPNNDLVRSRIRNFKRMQERRVVFSLGITYDTPTELVERAPQVVREIIEAQPLARLDRCHFNAFGDYALNIEAVYYMLSAEYSLFMDTHQAINLEVLRRFRELGIEFAFPTRTVHVYDEAAAARAEAART
jgi:small-conductance mechanosensitive channel